jgi:hypothetical protein
MELHKQLGIPLNSLLIGKVLTPSAADDGGFMSAASLGKCVSQGKGLGWSGGVMIWEWDPVSRKRYGVKADGGGSKSQQLRLTT